MLFRSFGLGAVAVLAVIGLFSISQMGKASSAETTETAQCQVAPFREAEAASLLENGAALVYHRTAGPDCVDELYAIYPDGRVTATTGGQTVEKQVPAEDVEALLVAISVDHGWFTAEIYSTYLNPCRQCYAHFIDISYDGQQKAVTGVDGTTAMPPGYAFALAEIRPLLPALNP